MKGYDEICQFIYSFVYLWFSRDTVVLAKATLGRPRHRTDLLHIYAFCYHAEIVIAIRRTDNSLKKH